VAENGLTLHPTKTRNVDARTEGFDFLGCHFRGTLRLPREKSEKKLRDTIRHATRRTCGKSIPAVCQELRSHLQGWFTYFRHCHWTTFRDLDQWTRGRLRSILRKRRGGRGRGRGKDHQRWPNAFFREQGFYSLQAAHVRFVQSSTR
jgi:RNA-directed DNA polymerase